MTGVQILCKYNVSIQCSKGSQPTGAAESRKTRSFPCGPFHHHPHHHHHHHHPHHPQHPHHPHHHHHHHHQHVVTCNLSYRVKMGFFGDQVGNSNFGARGVLLPSLWPGFRTHSSAGSATAIPEKQKGKIWQLLHRLSAP